MKKLIDSDISKYLCTGLLPSFVITDKSYSLSEYKEIWSIVKAAFDDHRPVCFVETSGTGKDTTYSVNLGSITRVDEWTDNLDSGEDINCFYMSDPFIRLDVSETGEVTIESTSEWAWGYLDGYIEEFL